MYDYTLHYCLQTFGTADTLYITDYLINDKQRFKMSAKGEYVKFQTYDRRIESQTL